MTTARPPISGVSFERVGLHIGMIVLDRPAVRNAVNADMAETIERLVARIEADADIRVGIIAGNGPSFCAGGDLREIAAGRIADLLRPQGGFAGFVYAPREKPWIAAVQGAAHGGGAEIVLACDVVIAAENASFGLTEAKRGLVAGAGGCYRLARTLPRPVAIEMATCAHPINARRAYEIGLVNRVVALEVLRAEAIAFAETVAANSPVAVRESLRLIRAAVDLDEPALRMIQDESVRRVIAAPDMLEGALAFIEKRAPSWRT